jgi:hypothetical protein
MRDRGSIAWRLKPQLQNQSPPTRTKLNRISELRTPNSELRTPNSELQTPNSKLRTPNSELQTPK